MSEEIKPKKERRFLKTLGRVGEILVEQVLLKLGSSIIKKIGGKKTLPSILFLLASLSLFAQYPNTGNKQRLGFQTTADGLTWRGSLSDTASIQPINNQNAWVILDTVNLKIYSFDFTSNTWNALPQGTNIDTTSLSNRIDLKLNLSDTAAMLLPYLRDADTTLLNLTSRFATKLNLSDTASMLANYATKAYADTTGRLYARQDFTNVLTSTLTWTQTDTLIPGGNTFVQVYRNGQILLTSQYTIPTSTSIVIAASSFKVGENYTVIFPRGGGAGSGSGSGSLTSISGGTGILVSPDPITTTGTVSADLSVLMELTDTSLLNLTSRFNTKQNTLVSGTNIKTVNSNSLLGSGNISVGTLVAADTVSLSNRINTKLNTTDTASLSNRINLKLNSADTASLSNRINAKGTGTVTSVATGYGLSGGTITSTGTLLLDSAVVFSRIRDSIVDIAIGTDTIKILKQEYAPATTSVLIWTITPKFPIQLKAYILVFRNGQLLINDQYNLSDTNKITIVSNSFKVGANYTVVTVSGIGSVGTGVFPNPVYPEAGIAVSTGSAWASSVPNNSANWNVAFNDKITNAAFSGTNTKTLTLTQYDGGTFTPTFTDLQGIVAADTASMLTPYLRKADTTQLNLTSRFAAKLNISDTASMLSNYNSRINLKLNTSDTAAMLSNYNTRINLKVNISDTLNMLFPYLRKADTTLMLSKYLRRADTTLLNLTSRFAAKLNISDTASMLSNYNSRINLKLNTSDTAAMLSNYNTRINLKVNISDTLNMLFPYLRKADTTLMLSKYLRRADTTLLNLTSRFAAKQNTLSGTGFIKASGTNITYDNSSYLTTGTAASTYQTILTNPVTGTGTTNTLPLFTGASTLGNSVVQQSSNNIGINTTPFASLTMGQGKNIMLDASSNNIPRILFYESNARNENDVQFGAKIQYNSPSDRLEFIMRDSFSADPSGDELAISIVRQTGNTTIHKDLTVTGNITENNYNVLTNLDTASLSSRIDSKYNSSGGTISGAVTLSETSATPSSLLGKSTGNVVGNVRLTSPLSLAGDSLNLATVPISKGGTGATSASAARTTLDVDYLFIEVSAGSSVSLTRNRISLVNTGTFTTTSIDLTPATNGRIYMIKNLAVGSVVSNNANVIPFAGGSPGTAILSAGNVTPQWVTLVADGTNWHMIQKN